MILIRILLVFLTLCSSAWAGNVVMLGGGAESEHGAEILGPTTNGTVTIALNSGYILCSGKAAAAHTGTVTSIEFYSSNTEASNDVRVGIYSDDAGKPGSLIGSAFFTDIGVYSASVKSFPVSINITQGNTYWQCIVASANGITRYYTDPGTGNNAYSYYQATTDFPSTFPIAASASTRIYTIRGINEY